MISISQVESYKGAVCIYSLNTDNDLTVFKDKYSNIFEGDLEYKNSLSSESDTSNLIIINGNDFNPNKITGCVKKYPMILLLVNDEAKIEKLKEVLLTQVLILDMNTLKQINLSNNIKENIEKKEAFRKEAEDKKREELKKENLLKRDEYLKNNLEFFVDLYDISNEITVISQNIEGIKSYFNGNNIIKIKFFEDINNLNKDTNDIIFIDASFIRPETLITLVRTTRKHIIAFLEISARIKYDKYFERNNLCFLLLNKPLDFSDKTISKQILDFLNTDFNTIVEKSLSKNPNIDNEYEQRDRYRNRYESKPERDRDRTRNFSEMKEASEKIQNVSTQKQEINKNNKRDDKSLSLQSLYNKLGLNNIIAYNSKIDKEIYTTNNGKVITYKPVGYFIEYRINRLQRAGFKDEDLNNILSCIEQADINFNINNLKLIESGSNN